MKESARILIVDDMKSNRELMRRFLERAGHLVEDAAGGREALAAIEMSHFDLVLMDIQMPGLDGLATTRALRERESGRPVPVIATTAIVSPEDIGHYRAAGMNACLGKPFRRAQLLDLVAEWLRRGETESAERAVSDAEGADFLVEARELMGEAWIRESLGAFDLRLEEVLEEALPVRGRDQLARAAHELVAQAAMFGFAALADALADLEGACKRDDGVGDILETARHCAQEARSKLQQYRESRPAHPEDGFLG